MACLSSSHLNCDDILNDISVIYEVLGSNFNYDEDVDEDLKKPVFEYIETKAHEELNSGRAVLEMDYLKPSWENCLGYNKAYQEVLTDSLKTLKNLLQDNLDQQFILQISMKNQNKNFNSIQRGVSNFVYPYFRDKSGRIPKPNKDSLLKESRDEKHILLLKPTLWSYHELKVLKEACFTSSMVKRITPFASRMEILKYKIENLPVDHDKTELEEEIINLESKIDEIEMNPEASVFDRFEDLDWLKISNTDFDGRRSPEECELMWNNLLHPSINNNEWSLEEDGLLQEAIEQAGERNWDHVANLMETSRTPFQCFIRYIRTHTMSQDKKIWTKEKDELLKQCIQSLKVGSYIPWAQAEKFLNGYTRVQIYHRWKYVLHPSIKKGQFTPEEDILILAGMKLFGNDLRKIPCLLPERTTCQIASRCRRLLIESEYNFAQPWTRAEDLKLIEAVSAESVESWQSISKHFPGRDGPSCSRRFISICRACAKNPELLKSKRLPLGNRKFKSHFPQISSGIKRKVRDLVRKIKSKGFDEKFEGYEDSSLKRKFMASELISNVIENRVKFQGGARFKRLVRVDMKLANMFLALSASSPKNSSTSWPAIYSQVKAIKQICSVLHIYLINMRDFQRTKHRELNPLDTYLFSTMKHQMSGHAKKKKRKSRKALLPINSEVSFSSVVSEMKDQISRNIDILVGMSPYFPLVDTFNSEEFINHWIPHKIITIPPNIASLNGLRALLIYQNSFMVRTKMKGTYMNPSNMECTYEATLMRPVSEKAHACRFTMKYRDERKRKRSVIMPAVMDLINPSSDGISSEDHLPLSSWVSLGTDLITMGQDNHVIAPPTDFHDSPIKDFTLRDHPPVSPMPSSNGDPIAMDGDNHAINPFAEFLDPYPEDNSIVDHRLAFRMASPEAKPVAMNEYTPSIPPSTDSLNLPLKSDAVKDDPSFSRSLPTMQEGTLTIPSDTDLVNPPLKRSTLLASIEAPESDPVVVEEVDKNVKVSEEILTPFSKVIYLSETGASDLSHDDSSCHGNKAEVSKLSCNVPNEATTQNFIENESWHIQNLEEIGDQIISNARNDSGFTAQAINDEPIDLVGDLNLNDEETSSESVSCVETSLVEIISGLAQAMQPTPKSHVYAQPSEDNSCRSLNISLEEVMNVDPGESSGKVRSPQETNQVLEDIEDDGGGEDAHSDLELADEQPIFNRMAERKSDMKLLRRLFSVFYWPILMSNVCPKAETIVEDDVEECGDPYHHAPRRKTKSWSHLSNISEDSNSEGPAYKTKRRTFIQMGVKRECPLEEMGADDKTAVSSTKRPRYSHTTTTRNIGRESGLRRSSRIKSQQSDNKIILDSAPSTACLSTPDDEAQVTEQWSSDETENDYKPEETASCNSSD